MSSREIRMIVSDVDGVWTDGKIIYTGEARETKEFNVRDGLGVKLAQKAGIDVAVLTSRRSRALERRCRELGIVHLHQGAEDKLREVRQIAAASGLTLDAICYIGDDLPDLAPIAAAGLSAAPSDAAPEVLERVTWRLTARGGEGTIRELVERLLKERGVWDAMVSDFHEASVTTPGV